MTESFADDTLDLGEDLRAKPKPTAAGPPAKPRVDLDRGARLCYHPRGYFVCMYLDEPGVYFDELLHPVSEQIAAEAGFDVIADLKARKRKTLTAEAMKKVEQQLAKMEKDVEAEVERQVEGEITPPVSPYGPSKPSKIELPPLPGSENDPQVLAAIKFGAGAITNAEGQLRETPDLLMLHVGRGWFKIIEKKTNEIIPDGEKLKSDQAVELMLKWHNVE